MSEIATGVTSSLVSRAADVVLKEKRRLVLALRETPLHGGHLRTMTTLADIGAVVAPIVPAFYAKPKTVDDIINHTVGRLLDFFSIETKVVRRCRAARRKIDRPSPGLKRRASAHSVSQHLYGCAVEGLEILLGQHRMHRSVGNAGASA